MLNNYSIDYNTGIQKKLFWVVSDLLIDYEWFEAAELKHELSYSLSRQEFLQYHNFSLKMEKNAIRTL